MRTYDPSAKCSKCGHDVVSTLFVRGLVASEQHLKRMCARCLYTWSEAPLDAGVPKYLTRNRWMQLNKVTRAGRV